MDRSMKLGGGLVTGAILTWLLGFFLYTFLLGITSIESATVGRGHSRRRSFEKANARHMTSLPSGSQIIFRLHHLVSKE